MRVILIHGKYFNSWEAQGLGYIAAFLRSKITDLELQFFQGVFDSEEAILDAAGSADWVLFSCTSPTYKWASCLAKDMKDAGNARTIIGGYHASAVPTLIGREFDHVVIGEGEWAAWQLLTEQVKSRYVVGKPMEFNELLWPDRVLIHNERNIGVAAADTGKRITSFQSHRGCPFHCKFCGDGACKVFSPRGHVVCRDRMPSDLLDEIDRVGSTYNLDFFKFCDPTWNLNIDWVKNFCRMKVSRSPSLPFFANIHAGLVDAEMMELMAAAGCLEIGLGVESGSDKILKLIGKGTTKTQIANAVALAKKYKISVRGYFILGVPEETEHDVALTESFADELDLDEYGFAMLCPYPGTDYYRGFPEVWETDWSKTDEYFNDFWHTDTISNGRLRELQLRLVDRFKKKITQHQKQVENV